MSNLTFAALGTITKVDQNADGTVTFEASKAAGPELDIDQQICDPIWAKSAMERWFTSGGNLREMHSSIAAGKALTLEHRADGEYISGVIVDPVSAKKMMTGTLQGLSVGIKAPRIVKDASARGGRIVSGEVVEVSLVDRPANPSCRIVLAKAAGIEADIDFSQEFLVKGHPTPWQSLAEVKPGIPPHNDKPDVTDMERQDRTKEGVPAASGTALAPSSGTGDAGGKAAEFIPASASGAWQPGIYEHHIDDAQGAPEANTAKPAMFGPDGNGFKSVAFSPELWEKLSPEAVKGLAAFTVGGDLAKGASTAECYKTAVTEISLLVAQEAAEMAEGEDERESIGALLGAYGCLRRFAATESAEDEWRAPTAPGGSVVDTAGSVSAEAGAMQDALMRQQTPPSVRGSGMMTYATDADLTKATQKIAELEDRLAKMAKTPIPGGPSRVAKAATATDKTGGNSEAFAKAAHYRRLAEDFAGSPLADGYRQMAEDIEKAVKST